MSSFRVVPVSSKVAEQVRNTGKSTIYGFPAHREVAEGRAPCRHCLRLIRKDEEELLLFTYDPFRELGEPPLPGPVYIHAEECARHSENDVIPEEYRGRFLTLDGYGDDRALVKEIRRRDGDEQRVANELLSGAEVPDVTFW